MSKDKDKVSIEELHHVLWTWAWSAETSADGDKWSLINPAWGQCAVTALVVQDYFGGDIIRVQAEGEGPEGEFSWGHYYNRLPSGVAVDFTQSQFPSGTNFSNMELRTRKSMLGGYPDTQRRYRILKSAVERFLK